MRVGTALHSGVFGGAICGAADGLAGLLAQLHGRDGRVALPGFYDNVVELSAAERALLRREGPDDAELVRRAGSPAVRGEHDYSLYERTVARPSVVVTGLSAGYTGPGPMAIIPAHAAAKLNFRLVATQNPDTVASQLRDFLAREAPPGLTVSAKMYGKAAPVVVNVRHPVVQAAATAYRATFARPPGWIRSGGTIPIASLLHREHIPVVLMGFALPDDRPHGPDERMHLPTFQLAVETSIRFLHYAAEALPPTSGPAFCAENSRSLA
jgi:acetylornithine deacetylase/succinyl-diaminopimelate desuccinylase-like protein